MLSGPVALWESNRLLTPCMSTLIGVISEMEDSSKVGGIDVLLVKIEEKKLLRISAFSDGSVYIEPLSDSGGMPFL